MRSARTFAFGATALLVAACGGDVTEIVLEVQSDLAVPEQMDEVRVVVTRPGGASQGAAAELGEEALPRTLTLVHAGGPLGPVEVDVLGRSEGREVLRRSLSLRFSEGRSLRFPVFLAAACRRVECEAGQTCERGACRAIEVRPCELAGTGCPDAGHLDAAADGCAPAEETCEGTDEDCDGRIDEDFELDTDPGNCGGCGVLCPETGQNVARGACTDGVCGLECRAGFGDCNRDPSDGCEVDTTSSMTHCGGCGVYCPSAGSFHVDDSVCAGGRCLVSCDAEWGDCDGDSSTGCETNLRVSRLHCAACDNPCAEGEMCAGGTCS